MLFHSKNSKIGGSALALALLSGCNGQQGSSDTIAKNKNDEPDRLHDSDPGEGERGDEPVDIAGTTICKSYGRVYVGGDSGCDDPSDGLTAPLAKSLGTVVSNTCLSGSKTSGILERKRCATDAECQWQIFMTGMNDDSLADLKFQSQVVEEALAAGKKVILLGHPNPRHEDMFKKWNELMDSHAKFAAADKNVWFIDTRTLGKFPTTPTATYNRTLYAEDGSHPSELAAETIFVPEIVKIIAAGKPRGCPDASSPHDGQHVHKGSKTDGGKGKDACGGDDRPVTPPSGGGGGGDDRPITPSSIPGVSSTAPALEQHILVTADEENSVFANGNGMGAQGHHGIGLANGGLASVGITGNKLSPGADVLNGFLVVWKNPRNAPECPWSDPAQCPPKGYFDTAPDSGVSASDYCTATVGDATTDVRFLQVLEVAGSLYVAGTEMVNSVYTATLYKFNADTCKLEWKDHYKNNAISGPKTSAYESITTYDDKSIVLGGGHSFEPPCLEGFKSGGNLTCGSALLVKHPLSEGAETTNLLPKLQNTYISIISLNQAKDGFAAVAKTLGDEVGHVLHIPGPQTRVGGTTSALEKSLGHQVTDISVSIDHYFVSGLDGCKDAKPGVKPSICGSITKVSPSTGKIDWQKTYHPTISGGLNQFSTVGTKFELNPSTYDVLVECWGITLSQDKKSVIAGCGYGIEPESCKISKDPKTCSEDPRGIWRSYVFAADVETGAVLWERLDSYQASANMPDAGDCASEFVSTTADGRIFSTNDESGGVGLKVFAPPSSNNASSAANPDDSGNSGDKPLPKPADDDDKKTKDDDQNQNQDGDKNKDDQNQDDDGEKEKDDDDVDTDDENADQDNGDDIEDENTSRDNADEQNGGDSQDEGDLQDRL